MNSANLTNEERRRRKREVVIIIAIIVIVAVLTFAENRVIHFGADFPISNTILMFILININLLLLILLIFLVLRNLVKLLYDRKRKVMGAKLRTKLVVAFIALTFLPTVVLFFFSINFIANIGLALRRAYRYGAASDWLPLTIVASLSLSNLSESQFMRTADIGIFWILYVLASLSLKHPKLDALPASRQH